MEASEREATSRQEREDKVDDSAACLRPPARPLYQKHQDEEEEPAPMLHQPPRGSDNSQQKSLKSKRSRESPAVSRIKDTRNDNGETTADDLMQRLLDAANAKDGAKIASLLAYKPNAMSNSIDDPLLLLPICNDLLQRHDKQSQSRQPQQESTRVLLLLAILDHVPTAYEIAWIASTRIQLQDRSVLASLQKFLRSAATAWCQYERKLAASPAAKRRQRTTSTTTINRHRTPRHYIRRLVDQAMTKVLQDEVDEQISLIGELLVYIVSLIRNIDDMPLLFECLDRIMLYSHDDDDESVDKSPSLACWLHLVSELRAVLRPSDTQTIQRMLTSHTDSIRLSELEQVAKAVMVLAIHCATCSTTNDCKTSSSQTFVDWQLILEDIMHCASKDLASTATVEQIMLEHMSRFMPATLATWMNTFLDIPTTNNGKTGNVQRVAAIRCNMLLLSVRASRRSAGELLSRIVKRAAGQSTRSKKQIDVKDICWKSLVAWTMDNVGLEELWPERSQNELTIGNVSLILDSVAYTGSGSFTSKNENSNNILSTVGERIFSSLYLGRDNPTDADRLHATERLRAWVDLAMLVIEKPMEDEDFYDWLLACLALIIVYYEAPAMQHVIAQKILDSYDGFQFCGRPLPARTELFCQVISVLLSSGANNNGPSTISALNVLAAAVSTRLPLDVFVQLASCLSPVEPVRHALLAVARKVLAPSNSSLWLGETSASGIRRLEEELDSVQCGVYALVVLVGTTTMWTSCELEAWHMLSDIIIADKPLLPLSSRSWMFQMLLKRASKCQIDGISAGRLLAAVLVRLCTFLSETDNKERFLATKVILFGQREDSLPLHMVDDVAGLLRLSLALSHALVGSDIDRKLLVHCWHDQLLLLVGDPTNIEQIVKVDIMHDCGTDPSYLIQASFLFLARIMESIFDVSYKAFANHKLKEMEAMLRNQARHVFAVADSLPSWLEVKAHDMFTSWRSLRVDQPGVGNGHTIKRILGGIVADTIISSRAISISPHAHVPNLSGSAERDVILGLSRLLAMMDDSDCGGIRLSSGKVSLLETFIFFAKLVVPAFQRNLSTGSSAADMDIILDATISLCSGVVCQLESSGIVKFPVKSDLAQSALSLYASVCEETAAIRLREYYFKASKQSSDAEIDLRIRSFRHKVVGVLANCIPLAFRCDMALDKFPSEAEGEDVQYPLAFLSKIVAMASRDLIEGMKGSSGMIDYDLFDAYHACLESCAREALRQIPLCEARSDVSDVASIFLRSAENLQALVCSYTLRQSGIFKMCLMFSMYNLPFVARTGMRQLLLDGYFEEVDRGFSNFGEEALRQCLIIMERDRYKLWDDVVDPRHMLVATDVRAKDGKLFSKYLQLESEQHWIWAFTSTLECFEYLWEESLSSFQTGATKPFQSMDFAGLYLMSRRDELTRVWRSLAPLLFVEQTDGVDIARAAQLPARIKLRLIALLDRMIVVQLKAMKTFILCLRKGSKVSRIRCLDVVEALACALVWLDSSDSFDLLLASAKWLSIEKEHEQKTKASLLRFEYAETSLRRLETIFRSPKDSMADLVSEADRLVYSLYDDTSDDDGDGEYHSDDRLLRLLQAKVKLMDKAQRKLSDTEITKKKARESEIALRARKEREVKLFRSRNKAVDGFHEDDKRNSLKLEFADASDYDPYEDLEDFIVEG